MSDQNDEIVRRFFDAIERSLNAWDRSRALAEAIRTGDLPPEVQGAFEYMSPEMEWRPGAAVFGVVTVENGRVVRVDEYSNRRDALEAAGLRE